MASNTLTTPPRSIAFEGTAACVRCSESDSASADELFVNQNRSVSLAFSSGPRIAPVLPQLPFVPCVVCLMAFVICTWCCMQRLLLLCQVRRNRAEQRRERRRRGRLDWETTRSSEQRAWQRKAE